MLLQCSPFADNTDLPYIIISPDMRVRLIEGGDRRTQSLPTMEEAAAIILIEYGDRSFGDIVLALRRAVNNVSASLRDQYSSEYHFQRISQTHAVYMPTHYVLLIPHGNYGWHWVMRLSSSTNTTPNNHKNNNSEGDYNTDVSESTELIRVRIGYLCVHSIDLDFILEENTSLLPSFIASDCFSNSW
jgi:hypothetical protein